MRPAAYSLQTSAFINNEDSTMQLSPSPTIAPPDLVYHAASASSAQWWGRASCNRAILALGITVLYFMLILLRLEFEIPFRLLIYMATGLPLVVASSLAAGSALVGVLYGFIGLYRDRSRSLAVYGLMLNLLALPVAGYYSVRMGRAAIGMFIEYYFQ